MRHAHSVTQPLRISETNRIDELPAWPMPGERSAKSAIVVPSFASDGQRESSFKHYGWVEPIGYISPVEAEANNNWKIAEPTRFSGLT